MRRFRPAPDPLAPLLRLWGELWLFHPALADESAAASFERALADFLRAGATSNALDGLLATLKDPTTRRISASRAPETSERLPGPSVGTGAGERALVSAGDWASSETISGERAWRNAAEFARRARASLWDFTGFGTPSDRAAAIVDSLFPGDGAPLTARVRVGWTAQTLESSGRFSGGLLTLAKSGRAPLGPVVAILPGEFPAPAWLVDCRARGLARVFLVGPPDAPRAHPTLAGTAIRLVDGTPIRARFADCACPIDAVFPSVELARDAAIAWLNDPKSAPPPPVPPPIHAPSQNARIESASPRAFSSADSCVAWAKLDAILRHFHPDRAFFGARWDTIALDALPAFQRASTPRALSLEVRKLLARVPDGHVVTVSPHDSDILGESLPPLRLTAFDAGGPSVDTRFVVARALHSDAAAAGVRAGDLVVSIDGRAGAARAQTLASLLAASHPSARNQYVANRLLNGPEGSVVKLDLRGPDSLGPDARVRTVSLTRRRAYLNGLTRASERDGIPIARLPGNVGYIDLDRVGIETIDRAFELLGLAPDGSRRAENAVLGLVFDLRGYVLETAWTLAARLTDGLERVVAIVERPMVSGPNWPEIERAGQLSRTETLTIRLAPGARRARRLPVCALIDSRTQSQAEWTALYLKAAAGATLVGTQTAGALGDVTDFVLPADIRVRFSGNRVGRIVAGRFASYDGPGITPDIAVANTPRDIRAGIDRQKDAARRHLLRAAK